MNRILGTAIAAALALGLASCGSDRPKGFICPASGALIDTASLTALPAGSTDPSAMLYRVDIKRVISDCDYDPETNTITARIQVDFTATRPPGGESAQLTIPYFIGVAEGSEIDDKKMYQVQFAFAPGQASQVFSDRVENFIFKPSPDKHSTDYEFLAGLQLTQEQLDYNRKVGRYVQ
jgi:hypothetical protein